MKHSTATKKTKKTAAKSDAPIPFRPAKAPDTVPRAMAEMVAAELDAAKVEIAKLRARLSRDCLLLGTTAATVNNLHEHTIGDLVTGALGGVDWKSHGFADSILDAIASEVNVLESAMYRHDADEGSVNEEDLQATLTGIGNRARYGAELARRLATARANCKAVTS